MAIDFSKYMDKEAQKALIESNLKAWAQDHYANSLTVKVSNDAEVIAKAEENMAAIEAAAVVAEAEMAALDTSAE